MAAGSKLIEIVLKKSIKLRFGGLNPNFNMLKLGRLKIDEKLKRNGLHKCIVSMLFKASLKRGVNLDQVIGLIVYRQWGLPMICIV